MKKYLLSSLLLVALNSNVMAESLIDEKPIPVTTAPIKSIAIYPINDIPATAISNNASTMSAEIKGLVTSLPLNVGEEAKAGETLVKIACEDYKALLSHAISEEDALKADLELSEWQLARTKKLLTDNNVSKELHAKFVADLKRVKAKLISQKSMITNAKKQVSRCNVVAPYDGIIIDRIANIGEYVTPGTKLIKIVDTQNMEVESLMHVNEIPLLNKAKGLNFNFNGINYPVKLRAIVQNQDTQSRTQLIRLSFLDELPLPGAAGRLLWTANFPAIPAEYIRQVGYMLGIFVAKGNHAKFIPLPNAIEGQPVIIEEVPSYDIIVDGRYSISDGSLINIQNLKKQ